MAEQRIIDDAGATALERALLASAAGDAPSPSGRARIAASLAAAAAATTVATTAGTSAATASAATSATTSASVATTTTAAAAAFAVPVGAWVAAAGVVGLATGALILQLGRDEGARPRAPQVQPPPAQVARAVASTPAPTPDVTPEVASAVPSAPLPRRVATPPTPVPSSGVRAVTRPPRAVPAPIPTAQTPSAQTPSAQTPSAQTSSAQTPIAQTPSTQAPIARTSIAQPPTRPAPAETGATALAEELALLGSARSSIAAGAAGAALATLDRYRARFPGGVLVQEAAIVRIEAHLARGDRDVAARLARDFLAAYPDSALSQRARSLAERAQP